MFRYLVSKMATPAEPKKAPHLINERGYDCEFVEAPPMYLQTECPICLQILREPHIVSCCGHNFCRPCIKRIQQHDHPCPLCNEPSFTLMHNKGLQRTLGEFYVCQADDSPQNQGQPQEIPPLRIAPRPKNDGGGYDCEFVDPPLKALQTDCSICLQILHEPYMISCCGHSFCRLCIEHIQQDGKACPLCNEPSFTLMHNKGLQRTLGEFYVRCTHQKAGCQWTGELEKLDQHLNVNPEPEKQLEGCSFAEVECLHCHKNLMRRSVKEHQEEQCSKRPYSCDYCREYSSTFENVEANHWPICPRYPLTCPNQCDSQHLIERQNLDHHLAKECPLQVIDCYFHYAGCEGRLPRKDMPQHLTESFTHISLVATFTQKVANQFTMEKHISPYTQEQAKTIQTEMELGLKSVENVLLRKQLVEAQEESQKAKKELVEAQEESQKAKKELVEAQEESQEAKEESQKAREGLWEMVGERNDLTAAVEHRDKQLDYERKALDAYKAAKSKLHSVVTRQENELEHLREDNTQLLDQQRVHKHEDSFPGMCLFGDPLQESVDSSGRLICWPQVGIMLDIPPGAVPSGEVLYLSIWPCLSGPYVLPHGWELASPVYLIRPAFNFRKPAKLSISHYARLSTDEDCDDMAFISTRLSPEYVDKKPEYHFKRCNGYAVFAVSLCQPLYWKNLDKDIKKQFHGLRFWRSQKHRVEMTGDAVEIKYPSAVNGWKIEPDRKPLRISQKEVDLPIDCPELSCPKENYPPRIRLTITPPRKGATCSFSMKVLGVSEPVEFPFQLRREEQPESNETVPLPHRNSATSTSPQCCFRRKTITSDANKFSSKRQ